MMALRSMCRRSCGCEERTSTVIADNQTVENKLHHICCNVNSSQTDNQQAHKASTERLKEGIIII